MKRVKNNFIKPEFTVFILLILFAFFFQACEKENATSLINDKEVKQTSNLHRLKEAGYTDPYLLGTFVDFWYKSTWTVNQWNNHMEEMQLVGVETIIVQFSAYNQTIWCDSPNNYSTDKYVNALTNLLQAAVNYGIDVYVGLYFTEDYWNNTNNSSKLSLYAQRCNDLADDIWNKYSNYASFKGWYIPFEPAPYYFNTQAKFNKFKNNLVNPVANHCKQISGKPVAIAAYFNETYTSSNDLLYFMNRLGSCNLDIIMLQDGTGASDNGSTPHCAMNHVSSYFNDAKWGLYGESPVFNGDFWADVETFNTQGNPETFERVKQKLDIVSSYVTNIVTFQYFEDMGIDSPHTGAAQTAADNLRNKYRTYYYNW